MAAKSKKTKPKLRDKRPRPTIIAVVLGLATLIGVPAALATFWPRVTVTPSDPVDPEQPFSASMTIANGILPLDSVYPSIALDDVKIAFNGHPITVKSSSPYQSVLGHDWPRRDLDADDRITFALNDLSIPFFYVNNKQLSDARIAVVVNYSLPIIHIKLQKKFYFFARKQTNGNFYWYSDSNPD